MSILPTEMIVSDIAGDKAKVKTQNLLSIKKLISLGFQQITDTLEKNINSVEDRVSLIHALIELDALFSAGRDWSPEELLNYYVELGYITESYRIIFWEGQGQYNIKTIQPKTD